MYKVSIQQHTTLSMKISVDRLCFISGTCIPHFIRLWGHFGGKISTPTWTWENQLDHSTLFHFLQTKAEEIGTGVTALRCLTIYVCTVFDMSSFSVGSLGLKDLRRTLFEQAVGMIFTVDQGENKIISNSTALLQVASCFGNHKASLLLAAVHLSGLGHTVDQQKVESVPSS